MEQSCMKDLTVHLNSWDAEAAIGQIRQLREIYKIQLSGSLVAMKKLLSHVDALQEIDLDGGHTEDEIIEAKTVAIMKRMELENLRNALNEGLQDLQEIMGLDKEIRQTITERPTLGGAKVSAWDSKPITV